MTAVRDLYVAVATRHAHKCAACIRLARQCSRDSWQHPENRAEFLRIKREAMNDARTWSLKP